MFQQTHGDTARLSTHLTFVVLLYLASNCIYLQSPTYTPLSTSRLLETLSLDFTTGMAKISDLSLTKVSSGLPQAFERKSIVRLCVYKVLYIYSMASDRFSNNLSDKFTTLSTGTGEDIGSSTTRLALYLNIDLHFVLHSTH